MRHSADPKGSQQGIQLPTLATVALFTWFTVISLFITGYRHIYGSNHAYQLVLVHRLNDPTLYPNDPFADTVYHYASVFWYVVAWVSRLVDLSIVLFVFFLVSKLLFLIAGFRLARTFFPNSTYAPIVGVAVMSVPPRPMLGDVFVVDYTQQSSIAIAASLLALDALLNKRWVPLALWLGISINMNLMYALFGITYLFASCGTNLINKKYKSLINFAIAFLGAILIGLPGIYLVLRAATYEVTNTAAVWKACELSFPFHFYPQLWGTRAQLFTLAASLIALGLAYWSRRISFVSGHVYSWGLFAFVWYLIAWLNPTVIHSLPLLHLHPVRATGVWVLLITLFTVAAAVYWMERKRIDWVPIPGLFVILAVILLVFAHSVKAISFWLLLAATLCGSEIARQVVKRQGARSIQRAGAVAYVSILLVYISVSGIAASLNRLSQTGNWLGIGLQPAYQIAEWVRENTNQEAVFLIPIGGGQGWLAFRHLSQRSVFTHLKDGTAWTYAPWFADDWLARLRDLGFYEVIGLDDKSYKIGSWIHVWSPDGRNFAKVYDKVDDNRVAKLKKRYRIDYWITRATVKTRFPKVYEHAGWQVLKVSE